MYDFKPQEILKAAERAYLNKRVYQYDFDKQLEIINKLVEVETKKMLSETKAITLTAKDTVNLKNHKLPGDISYIDKNSNIIQTYIKKVVYSNPATIVFWADDTKTISKCSKGDKYCPEIGLSLCILKKMCGPSDVKKTLQTWIPISCEVCKEGTTFVQTLKDVRKQDRLLK